MTDEEFGRSIQEAGEKDFMNFQSGIILLSKLRPIMAKYGLGTKDEQDAKLREVHAAGKVATLMQYCPAAEPPEVLCDDGKGGTFDALMLVKR
ncbi:MAG: hypothetical protein IJR14_03650 [Synergistaceae bacterium]|nr:hypothetical protein [Synergistaceae bacterium]